MRTAKKITTGNTRAVSGIAIMAVLAFAPFVHAQSRTAQTLALENQIINEQQIVSFARATVAIDKINREYAVQLSAGEREENKGIFLEAEQKMIEAIHSEGLTIPEYHRIAGAVIADEATHERVVQHLAQLQNAETRGEETTEAGRIPQS